MKLFVETKEIESKHEGTWEVGLMRKSVIKGRGAEKTVKERFHIRTAKL